MALTNTVLTDAIILVGDSKMGKSENRLSNYGAFAAFKDNAEMLLPKTTVESIKKSARQVTKVPVLNKFSSTVITAPSCSITGNRATSAFKTLSWAAVGFEATIIPSVNEDNYISAEEDLANQITHGVKAVLASLDTSCVSALESAKSMVLATSKLATAGTGVYNYTKAVNQFFIDAPSIMSLNDLEGPYVDVANTESAATRAHIQTLAQFNSQNLAGNLNGSIPGAGQWAHYGTNRIAPGTNAEVHYIMPEGTIGIYNWIDRDSAIGRQAGNKKWYQMQDPIAGMNWGVFQVDDCADASSEVSGLSRAYAEKYQFVTYVAIVTDYSSDTSSPIYKFTLNPA